MLKRNKELYFSKDELSERPWFEADLLGREPHIKTITDLLTPTEGQFVMTVSSPWGTGKTTFMRMWKAYLESLGHPCVLFNAWEHDFAENPFLTFIAEMHEQLYELRGGGQQARRRALTGLKAAGKRLFPKLISVGMKAGLGVSVDFEQLGKDLFEDGGIDIAKVGENLTTVLSDSAEAYASDVLEDHKETKVLLARFKKCLEKVVENLGDLERPMFFFVDELDRCKPTYAVELLEAVKHIFEVNGIIFVLSLDREQLGHSVRAAYGDRVDADGYLRRFIDLEYRIPEPSKVDFVQHLAEVYGVEDYPYFVHSGPGDALQDFLNEFNSIATYYSLRTIEKAFLRGTVLLQGLKFFADQRIKIVPNGLAHCIFLRELSPFAFEQMLKGIPLVEQGRRKLIEFVPKGISSRRIDLWVKLKSKWTPLGFDVNQVIQHRDALRNDVDYAYLYKRVHDVHLIDDVGRLLNLSGQLLEEG